jgi:hypothetical protein
VAFGNMMNHLANAPAIGPIWGFKLFGIESGNGGTQFCGSFRDLRNPLITLILSDRRWEGELSYRKAQVGGWGRLGFGHGDWMPKQVLRNHKGLHDRRTAYGEGIFVSVSAA